MVMTLTRIQIMTLPGLFVSSILTLILFPFLLFFFFLSFLSFSDARIRYCLPAIACLASQGQDGFGSPYQSTGVPM